MAQRIHNLSKWRFMPEGRGLHYPGRAQRTVVLEVNCPSEVCFYVVQERAYIESDPERERELAAGRFIGDPGEEQAADRGEEGRGSISFIGLCTGRDTLEFAVDGPFDLIVEGGSAYVFSNDGQEISTKIIAPLIFTRIANRRQRNPHLEMMQYQMKLNQERMQAQLLEEITRREEALERRLESYASQRNEHAPPELVGKARRDGGAVGSVESDAGASEPPSDEIGGGEEVSGKRKKSKSAADV